MDLGIRGRRALVGGASSGLGRAIAERLAAEGCELVVTARRGQLLAALAADLERAHGVRAVAVPADFADPATPAALAEAATAALGGIDILVLNAGGPPPVDPAATDPAGWSSSLQVLLLTPVALATALLPGMRSRGWGRIVSVLSYGVRQPIRELSFSNAGRSALVAWLKTVAGAVAADGVTVNGALPGRHATPRIEELDRLTAERTGRTPGEIRAGHLASIPAGRYGDPAEFAAYVAWLCSSAASYQTGTFTAIDGGIIAGLP